MCNNVTFQTFCWIKCCQLIIRHLFLFAVVAAIFTLEFVSLLPVVDLDCGQAVGIGMIVFIKVVHILLFWTGMGWDVVIKLT